MAFTKITKDMNIIAALADEPNDVGGLSAAQLKAKFDEGGLALKTFVNGTLIDELEAGTAAASIGAKDGSNNDTTLQSVLNDLIGAVVGQIPDGSITAAKLHSDAVETAKIKDGAVTDAKVDWTSSAIARVEIQSYVGTGTVGESNKTTITFQHLPKLVIVLPTDSSHNVGSYIYGAFLPWNDVVSQYGVDPTHCTIETWLYIGTSTYYQRNARYVLSNSNKTIAMWDWSLSLPDPDAATQLNTSGTTYTVISFY